MLKTLATGFRFHELVADFEGELFVKHAKSRRNLDVCASRKRKRFLDQVDSSGKMLDFLCNFHVES